MGRKCIQPILCISFSAKPLRNRILLLGIDRSRSSHDRHGRATFTRDDQSGDLVQQLAIFEFLPAGIFWRPIDRGRMPGAPIAGVGLQVESPRGNAVDSVRRHEFQRGKDGRKIGGAASRSSVYHRLRSRR